MPGFNMNAGLDAGPSQTWCGARSVLGPDFGEIQTSASIVGITYFCNADCLFLLFLFVSFFFLYIPSFSIARSHYVDLAKQFQQTIFPDI